MADDRNGSDEQLLARVSEGDTNAFELLFSRYSAAVVGYASRMLGGDRVSAEDITQSVWEKLVDAASKFSGTAFTAWLFTIVRNTVLDELRRQGRWKTEELDEETENFELASDIERLNAEDLLIRFSRHHELRVRIDRLPDRQRIALLSWLESGLSQKELAAQLGMTVEALEKLLGRAKKNLLADQQQIQRRVK